MRLNPRDSQAPVHGPRIAISQDEITADLHYPASRQPVGAAPRPGCAGGGGERGLGDRGERDAGIPTSAPRAPAAGPWSGRTRWRPPPPGASWRDRVHAGDRRGELPPPPIAVTMNMRPIELEEGRVVFAGEPGEEHYNPIGVVHGGYAATLLDSALGCAVAHDAAARRRLHLARARGQVRAPDQPRHAAASCARRDVLYRGRRQATAEASLTAAESGKLLAPEPRPA